MENCVTFVTLPAAATSGEQIDLLMQESSANLSPDVGRLLLDLNDENKRRRAPSDAAQAAKAAKPVPPSVWPPIQPETGTLCAGSRRLRDLLHRTRRGWRSGPEAGAGSKVRSDLPIGLGRRGSTSPENGRKSCVE